MSDPEKCPRCGGVEFEENDAGPCGFDDDISYTAYICKGCRLYFSGWTGKWYLDCESWRDEEYAEEFTVKVSDGRNNIAGGCDYA